MKVHYSTPENQEYFFDEGCHILELYNDPENSELSIARARVAANTETRLHALSNTIERYIILSGEGIATIDEKEYLVKTNDVLIIDKGIPQKIRNTKQEDLVFLAVCSPRFTPECYQEV